MELKIPLWMVLLEHIHLNKKTNMETILGTTNTTYSHAHKILNALQNKNLILIMKDERAHTILPTHTGNQFGERIHELKQILEE